MQRQKPRDKCDVKKSVDELRKEIAHEQEWTRLQKKSNEQWESLLTDMKKKTDPDSSKDSEWRTRYYFQTLYNDMLRQQKAEMRAELRMMRHGQWSLRRGSNLNKMSEAECRKHVKSMELELKSLKGLCTTYDRQIDSEAMAYSAAHNESDAILNDVWFQEKMRIVEQENRDKAEIYARKQSQRRSPRVKYKKPIQLPPLHCGSHGERKSSYSKMFEFKRMHQVPPTTSQTQQQDRERRMSNEYESKKSLQRMMLNDCAPKKHVRFSLDEDWFEDNRLGDNT